MSDVTFKAGDRAKVNAKFDFLVPDRDRLIGKPGVVTDVIPDAPERMYFKADDPSLMGWGPNGSWAVIDYELDKLED